MKMPSPPPPLMLPCTKLLWLTRRTRVIALEAKGTKAMPRTSKPSIFLFIDLYDLLRLIYTHIIFAHRLAGTLRSVPECGCSNAVVLPTLKIDPKCRVLRMFGRSARDAVFAIVILAGYVIGAKNQATVAILDTS